MTSLDEEKAALRRAARKARRAAMDKDGSAASAVALHGEEFLSGIKADTPLKVAGYVPTGSEIDPRQLMSECRALGWTLALPVVVEKNAPLVFRTWMQGEPLVEGFYGIPVPEDRAPEIIPDIVLVPLLAFDDRGYRLGQGGGYYDRTLPLLKSGRPSTLSIGVAFSTQKIDAVPVGENDQRLDVIVTDAGWTKF